MELVMRPLLPALLLALALPTFADDAPKVQALGARLEHLEYPYPVTLFPVKNQGQSLEMAYMDLKPEHPNGRTAVLLHGKNFCGAYWAATAEHLRNEGYRVVIPDQIGFCKSSKPHTFQYSFHQLAANTHDLLASLGVNKATIVAHSMGGMVGARYALMYPQGVEKLVLVNPIGLEDWKAKGVPWQSVDQWYARDLKTSYAGIRQYQLAHYYDGRWKPEYDRWALMQAGQYEGDGKETSAWAGALTYDMVFTQPVVYEFPQIKVPTVLIIGQRDTTAIADGASPDVKAKLGNYPELGKEAAARIPGARLIPLDGLAHSPMIEAPERFYKALDEAL
jgi:pimeloyl-ACP methyl ester carboxylesterase